MEQGTGDADPILDSLRKDNKIRVETLGESGAWFKGMLQGYAGDGCHYVDGCPWRRQ